MQETVNLIASRLRYRKLTHHVFLHPEARNLVRLRDLDKVRIVAQVGLGVVALIEELLPLAHHAEILVVDDDHLDRQPETVNRGELLDVHLETAIAGNAEDAGVRLGQLHADRRWKSEAHRAQATGRNEP